jgi:hypothetical protein
MVQKPASYRILSTIFLFHISCFLLLAQTPFVSYKAEQKELTEVLNDLSELTGYRFSYNPSRVNTGVKVTVDINAADIGEALQFLAAHNISYRILKSHIVLKPAPITPVESVDKKEARPTLSGRITDASDGEALIGATIAVVGTGMGTITNGYGYFFLNLPEGSYDIRISYVGYDPVSAHINLISDKTADHALSLSSRSIEEVSIVYNPMDSMMNPATAGSDNLDVSRGMQGFTGEPDVIKTLTSMPGISFFSDGSSLFYVRGGDRDQNMILIDEAPVYNPAHLLGIFSLFPPAVLNNVLVYKGEMPASFGGRLSSVIDIKMKEGNSKELSFSGNTSPLSTTLMLEAPLNNQKGSFLLSARRSHLRWLLKESAPGVENLYFSDLNMKFNLQLNEKNRLYVSGYFGSDKYQNRTGRFQSDGLGWQNAALTVRWNHFFGNRLFLNTSFIASEYDYQLFTSYERKNRWESGIALLGLKTDFSYYLNPNATLRFGAFLGNHWYSPGNFMSGNKPDPLVAGVPKKKTAENVLYFSGEHEIGEKFSLRYGLRLTGWLGIGPATEYAYDEFFQPTDTLFYTSGDVYSKLSSVEPRLSLLFKPADYLTARLSYSRNGQFEYLISNSVSPFTSLEVWLPAGPNIRPMSSDQLSGGVNLHNTTARLDLSADFYLKKIHNYIGYTDHAYMLFNPQVESELRYGTGLSRGLEIAVKKRGDRYTASVNYSRSTTMLTIRGVNNGDPYPASHDRPHTLNLSAEYRISPRFSISASWVYASGSPFTVPSGYYIYNNYRVPYYAGRNNSRLPDYHRFDVLASFRLNRLTAKNEHLMNFSIFNLYGQKNPFNIYFNKVMDDYGNLLIPMDHKGEIEYQPGMLYVYGVIPTISYHFAF